MGRTKEIERKSKRTEGNEQVKKDGGGKGMWTERLETQLYNGYILDLFSDNAATATHTVIQLRWILDLVLDMFVGKSIFSRAFAHAVAQSLLETRDACLLRWCQCVAREDEK